MAGKTPGRKPNPTQLKVAQGNPGNRKLNKVEPKPEPGIPECPDHIKGEARKEWYRICAELKKLDLITKIDRAALAVYCQAWERWVDAENQIRAKGVIVLVGDNKYPQQSPYLAVANKAMKQMMDALTEFGMTPSSRSRISVSAPDDNRKEKTRDFILGKQA